MDLWIIGFLFCVGSLYGNEPEEEFPWYYYILAILILLVAWPIVLGAAVSIGDKKEEKK